MIIGWVAVCGHCYRYNRNEFNPTEPYFLQHFACWGWGTWRRIWEKTEWDTELLVKNIKNIRVRKKLDIGLGAAVSGNLYDSASWVYRCLGCNFWSESFFKEETMRVSYTISYH